MVRRLALLLVLVLFAGACTAISNDTTTLVAPTATTVGDTPATAVAPGTTETTSSATTTAVDLSGLDVTSEVREQLENLIIDAQEVRGLAFLEPPTITVVSESELESRVRGLIEEEAEDFPADEALYKLFGLLDPEADLEAILLNLYGEQVAGFYDGETGEIVVPARDDGFSLLQQATMVHELVHALTDQHFDFDSTFQAMIDEERLDQASA